MRSRPANLRVGAAMASAALAVAGCGGGSGSADGPRGDARPTVELTRVEFPRSQRVGMRSSFVLTVRNAGDARIPNLVAVLRGFEGRRDDTAARRPAWLLDAPPAGTATAIDETWAAGPLDAGERVTLRWRVTAVRAGAHRLDVAIAGGLGDRRGARLRSGAPARATLAVRVASRPAFARVDPRTGRVVRE